MGLSIFVIAGAVLMAKAAVAADLEPELGCRPVAVHEKLGVKAKDRDGDGIGGKKDKCPDHAEVENGWLDDDGCPDQLGMIHLTTSYRQKIMDHVKVVISDGHNKFSVVTLRDPIDLELLPGEYAFEARTPGFAVAEQLAVAEGENQIDLALEATTPATLRIIAYDENGDPLPRAGVSFSGLGAPDSGYLLAEEPVDVVVPAGTLEVFIKAKGLPIWRDTVDLEPAEIRILKAVLREPRARAGVKKVEIDEKVEFLEDGVTIAETSWQLLNEVAVVLHEAPGIKAVEIASHAASGADRAEVVQMTDNRAAAVRVYLTNRGVDPVRLQARGYGDTAPISSNRTQSGRAANDRVDFNILLRE
jgi:outer membrane protein OmpA-like peptidoglycan-associated protein